MNRSKKKPISPFTILTPSLFANKCCLTTARRLLVGRSEVLRLRYLADAIPCYQSSLLNIVGPFIGGPATAVVLESLRCPTQTQLILIGSCGLLAANCPDGLIGDVLIPTASHSEDGTSRLYGLTNEIQPIDCALATDFTAFLSQNLHQNASSRSIRKGSVWTTDAPFKETSMKVQNYAERDIMGVEMELATLVTLSRIHSWQFAAAFVVSDIVGRQTKTGFTTSDYRTTLNNLAELAVQFVLDHNR